MLVEVYITVTTENSNSVLNLALGVKWNIVNYSIRQTWEGGFGMPERLQATMQIKVRLSAHQNSREKGQVGEADGLGASFQLLSQETTVEVRHIHRQP